MWNSETIIPFFLICQHLSYFFVARFLFLWKKNERRKMSLLYCTILLLLLSWTFLTSFFLFCYFPFVSAQLSSPLYNLTIGVSNVIRVGTYLVSYSIWVWFGWPFWNIYTNVNAAVKKIKTWTLFLDGCSSRIMEFLSLKQTEIWLVLFAVLLTCFEELVSPPPRFFFVFWFFDMVVGCFKEHFVG